VRFAAKSGNVIELFLARDVSAMYFIRAGVGNASGSDNVFNTIR
jgi:hypothetical protein